MLGLKIAYKPIRNFLVAEFVIADQPKSSPTFFTNQEVRDSIAAAKLSPGYHLGNMSIEVLDGSATWKQFFPFRVTRNKDFFTKKGISRILELKFLLELSSRFPSVKQIVHSKIVSNDRTRFLSRKGLVAPTDLKTYIAYLREEIGTKTTAFRKKVSEHDVYHRRVSLQRKRAAQRSGTISGPYRKGH
jgi:hypothetical protein